MKLPRFGVEEWLNVHEKSASHDIAGVTISSLSLAELFELTQQDINLFYQELALKKMDYGWIEGSPEFKKEVCQLYETVTTEQVLQTNGATGANMLVLYALIEPKDHVISMFPTYQQLYDIPKSLGAQVTLWPVKEENKWLPDLDELRQLIRPNTKMICINNANNPTGAIMDETYLKELVSIAESCGAYILADEVYKSFSLQQNVPAIVDLYERGISVDSLSKTYSLPGIRVGWVAASKAISDILRDYRDYTMICAGVLDDMLAAFALKHRLAIIKRNQKIVTKNFQILKNWLAKETRAQAVLPNHVSMAFVKLDVPLAIEAFCKQLLADYGVLLVPGNRFGIEGHVRLGYCGDQDMLREALNRLSQCLHQYD
ncbi:aminotransferase [Streptococcus macacae]|uniref:Aminotransferase n=1 Tax=Streptococcus macacae NCTC 11558 TaxID=764298 RepID=G5JZ64_9STRE|nr:aminotransferase [Streptococcus macacae]EHJ52749.1 dipeptidase [Streptococcus macacae NCTC 11558]SUN78316.1 transaminase [Streptococcus macacae NCTC 11558]